MNENREVLRDLLNYLFLKKIIYLFMTERERERERERWQKEKQAPCREPEVGLDPRSPGSHPGLKVALNRWATGAATPLFLSIHFSDALGAFPI